MKKNLNKKELETANGGYTIHDFDSFIETNYKATINQMYMTIDNEIKKSGDSVSLR